jgi:hypothetical protein
MALSLEVVTDVPDDEDEVPTGRSSFRDPFQLDRDADVKVLFDAWQAKGKPTHEQLTALTPNGKPSPEFKAADKKVYIVAKADRVEVKRTIRRACLLYKPNDETGTLGGVPIYVADKKLEDGRYRIKFTWSPQPVKTESNNETPPADTPPGDGTVIGNLTDNQKALQDTSGEQGTPTTGSQPQETAGTPPSGRGGLRIGGRR